MLDVNDSPRPKLLSRLNFAAQTDGALLPPTLVTLTSAPDVWAFVFAHTYPERSLLGSARSPTTPTMTVLLWVESTAANHTGGTLHAAWPGTVRAVDMMGNAMSADPIVVSASHVFIHVSTSDVVAVESALRAATCKGCAASNPPRRHRHKGGRHQALVSNGATAEEKGKFFGGAAAKAYSVKLRDHERGHQRR